MPPHLADTRRPALDHRKDQYVHGYCPECLVTYRWPRSSVPLKAAACPFHHRHLERVHHPNPDTIRTIIRPPTYFIGGHP